MSLPRIRIDVPLNQKGCVDPDDELTAGEIAAKGLDTRKRWFRCTADHGQHCACGPPPAVIARPRG